MGLVLTSILFLMGLLLIIKGGDLFVDAATWMARASGIPQFIIGATIVSIATTLPEIIVSTMAALDHNTEMAIGNAIGSVTANTGLIMGVSLIFMPIVIRRSRIALKGILMLLSCTFLWLLSSNGNLNRTGSFIILLLFFAFIAENLHSASLESAQAEKDSVNKKDLSANVVKFLLGALCLVVGSRLLVDNGTILAEALGVPTRVIAVTMVAIGTSLPELVTAITAIVKKQTSMSVGNILGANIIDITVILPLCALLSQGSLPVSDATLSLDMPICLLEAGIAIIPTILFQRFYRLQGVIMVALYLAYLGFTVMV